MSLGQDVSSIEATLNSVGASLAGHPIHRQHGETQKDVRHLDANIDPSRSLYDVGSRLAQGSAADLDALSKDKTIGLSRSQIRSSQSNLVAQHGFSSKRKRAESLSDVEHQMDYVLGGKHYQKGQSRDLMPPPPIPLQQPYVFTASIPNQDVNEILNQNGDGSRSQSGRSPATPHQQRNPSDLRRMTNTSRGKFPPTPSVTANDGSNPSPYGLRLPPPRMPTARPTHVDHTFPPSVIARHKEESDGRLSLEPSSVRSIGNIPHRHTQFYNNGNPKFPLELDNRPIHPYPHSNHSTSRLGLSSNARSSGHQTSQSPSSSNSHRRPLGQDVSASPHFLPGRLSSSTSMSSLRGQQSTSMSHTNSYSSMITTRLDSQERGDRVGAQENSTESDRGRNYIADVGAPISRRLDPSRGRLPTPDAEASAQRRRANR